MSRQSGWCQKCHREYVKKGKECTVCRQRDELNAVLVVFGIMTTCFAFGLAALFSYIL